MELTTDFVVAVERGADALIDQANNLEPTIKAKADNLVGRIVRRKIEESRQTADMLRGWAVRARKEAGMEPREW